ncbi:hypothetical protein ACLKA7_001328 [Drosophila subpalustris]
MVTMPTHLKEKELTTSEMVTMPTDEADEEGRVGKERHPKIAAVQQSDSQKTTLSEGTRSKRQEIAGPTGQILRPDRYEEDSHWNPRPIQSRRKDPTKPMETRGPTHHSGNNSKKRESLAPIDATGGELNFEFSSVFIRVYKSDAAVDSDKPVEEDIASQKEAPECPEMDGYMSDASSLTRELRKLWQTGDLEVPSDIASDI